MIVSRFVHITPSGCVLDGTPLETSAQGAQLLTELYRTHMGDYPKFFKMDILCKLGVIATELLVKDEPGRFELREDRAILLFSKSGPLCNDINYENTTLADNYFPSPSLFVYTLANIVTGEISIRNKYKGDTTAFELPSYDPEAIVATVEAAFEDKVTASGICGWVECASPESFEAIVCLVEKDGEGDPFNVETLNKLK